MAKKASSGKSASKKAALKSTSKTTKPAAKKPAAKKAAKKASKKAPAKTAAKKPASKKPAIKKAAPKKAAPKKAVPKKAAKRATSKLQAGLLEPGGIGSRIVDAARVVASVAAAVTPSPSRTASATAPPESQFCYPLRVPERLTEASVVPEIRARLTGTPSDGSTPKEGGNPSRVIWVDGGDEVLVHLDSLKFKFLDRLIVASLDLECDQTGRQSLVCVFATGAPGDNAGLLCTTDELPRGNALLVARWGEVTQMAIWNALLAMLRDHADERHLVPSGLSAAAGVLMLRTKQSVGTIPFPVAGGGVIK